MVYRVCDTCFVWLCIACVWYEGMTFIARIRTPLISQMGLPTIFFSILPLVLCTLCRQSLPASQYRRNRIQCRPNVCTS